MSSVTVVIPVYGRPDMLERCLRALPEDVDTIVVDDCSPKEQWDEIEELVRHGVWHGRANGNAKPLLFRNKQNYGFPYTVNRGVRKVTTPLVLLLNSDVILAPDAIDILNSEMSDPKVGIAAPMLVFPPDSQWGNPGKIQHVGMAYSIFGLPYHLFIGWSPLNPRAAQRRDTLRCVTGACFLTRKTLWHDTGGFSVDYGRGTYEDVEFCLDALERGYKIVCNPAAQGVHYVGQSAVAADKGFDLRRNEALFRLRNKHRILHDEYVYL